LGREGGYGRGGVGEEGGRGDLKGVWGGCCGEGHGDEGVGGRGGGSGWGRGVGGGGRGAVVGRVAVEGEEALVGGAGRGDAAAALVGGVAVGGEVALVLGHSGWPVCEEFEAECRWRLAAAVGSLMLRERKLFWKREADKDR